MDRLQQFFSDNFYTPHGMCLLWLPEIVWLHVVADALIALAYFSIPVALWRFYKLRPDMPLNKVLILFASFIMLCGMTHVLGIIVLWHPYYGIEGLVMLATGIVSMFTAFFVWKNFPIAMKIPSPIQLQIINQQLSESYEMVEQKVQDRTHELETITKQMADAKHHADEANEAKSRFLTNMSHEIRTPMNAIIGIANLLSRNDQLSEKDIELIKILKLSSDSMMVLIDDLLDISRIESGTLKLQIVPFSVVEIVENVIKIMDIKAKDKDLDFRSNIKCACIETRKFMGDPDRLRQILVNLCGNAIKFTEHGSVIIGIECIEKPNTDIETVIIDVTDTGIGIAENKKTIIFEKFVQADNSITRKYGGSGLGLAITKDLITAMGGTLTVASHVGQGSTFKISIPLKIVASKG